MYLFPAGGAQEETRKWSFWQFAVYNVASNTLVSSAGVDGTGRASG